MSIEGGMSEEGAFDGDIRGDSDCEDEYEPECFGDYEGDICGEEDMSFEESASKPMAEKGMAIRMMNYGDMMDVQDEKQKVVIEKYHKIVYINIALGLSRSGHLHIM